MERETVSFGKFENNLKNCRRIEGNFAFHQNNHVFPRPPIHIRTPCGAHSETMGGKTVARRNQRDGMGRGREGGGGGKGPRLSEIGTDGGGGGIECYNRSALLLPLSLSLSLSLSRMPKPLSNGASAQSTNQSPICVKV